MLCMHGSIGPAGSLVALPARKRAQLTAATAVRSLFMAIHD
jgi:hypothetical protein